MNRHDFQKLARIRLEEAKVLLRNGKYEGCYYLCGYAVECALKACIAKMTKRYDFPGKNLIKDAYTHDLDQLVRTAELKPARDAEFKDDGEFEKNWNIVKQWSEQRRYELAGRKQALELFNAVANRRNGVLRWVRQYW